jgi:membrane-bound metal-dependent hydrolase YbcI (DUF457 family)
MASHLLFGGLAFCLVGLTTHHDKVNLFLFIMGAMVGIVPDLLSFINFEKATYDRWSYRHRDGLSHSIFFAPITAFLVWFVFNYDLAIMLFTALLTHPLLDLFGIGWGVKLFYPFSKKTFKLFYKGEILWIFTSDQLEWEVEAYGVDDWFMRILKRRSVPVGLPMWVIIFEWLCFILFLACIIYLYNFGPVG